MDTYFLSLSKANKHYDDEILEDASELECIDIDAASCMCSSPQLRPKGSPTFQVRRKSVFAESSGIPFGQGLTVASIECIPTHNPAECAGLKQLLKDHVLFAEFTEADLDLLIAQMHRMEKPAGEVIAKQGELANEFYIVEKGQCDAYVSSVIDDDISSMLHVQTICPGTKCTFGELSLLHFSPHTASLIVTTPSTLWMLEGMKYRHMKAVLEQNKLKKITTLLSRTPLFAALNKEQITKLAELAEMRVFEEDQVIFRYGQAADTLYVVESGTIVLSRNKEGVILPPLTGEDTETHEEIGIGEVFGECALNPTKNKYLATSRAVGSGTKCIALNRRVLRNCLSLPPSPAPARNRPLTSSSNQQYLRASNTRKEHAVHLPTIKKSTPNENILMVPG